jgi:hypothetical protein
MDIFLSPQVNQYVQAGVQIVFKYLGCLVSEK